MYQLFQCFSVVKTVVCCVSWYTMGSKLFREEIIQREHLKTTEPLTFARFMLHFSPCSLVPSQLPLFFTSGTTHLCKVHAALELELGYMAPACKAGSRLRQYCKQLKTIHRIKICLIQSHVSLLTMLFYLLTGMYVTV